VCIRVFSEYTGLFLFPNVLRADLGVHTALSGVNIADF